MINKSHIDRFVRKAMKDARVLGAVVGIFHKNHETVLSYGITNKNHPLPVTKSTYFQIGSITKTFTCSLIMKLMEEGRLSLEDRVRKHLPDFRVKDEEVSNIVKIQDLLTHTAGWYGDHFKDFGRGDDALRKIVSDMSTLEQIIPLGTTFSYNNASSRVAGRIIEVMTGHNFQEAVKKYIFDPLEMKNSFFFPEDIIMERFASGHGFINGKHQVIKPWGIERSSNSAGGIITTAHDLLLYARAQMKLLKIKKGSSFLKAETIDRMQTSIVAGVPPQSIGLSWFIDEFDGIQVVSHGGKTMGQASKLVLVPQHKLAFTIFTNGDEEARDLVQKIHNFLLEKISGIKMPGQKTIKIASEVLQSYEGRYGDNNSKINIRVKAGKLFMDERYKSLIGENKEVLFSNKRLIPIGKDSFRLIQYPYKGGVADFIKDESGRVSYFRIGGRAYPRLKGI